VADITSILSSNYLTVGAMTQTPGQYVAVNPDDYQGSWTGQYGDGTKFTVQISNVNGFKANVKYQSGSTVNYGQVLIKNSSFRIGDSKFVLAGNGTAQIATVVTDAYTGATSLKQAYATQG